MCFRHLFYLDCTSNHVFNSDGDSLTDLTLTLPPGLQRAEELSPAPRAPEVQPELRPNRNWDGTDTEIEPEPSPYTDYCAGSFDNCLNVFFAFFFFLYRPKRHWMDF